MKKQIVLSSFKCSEFLRPKYSLSKEKRKLILKIKSIINRLMNQTWVVMLYKVKQVLMGHLISLIRVYLTLKIQITLILHQHLEARTSPSKLF
jgi:hypothetical protein